MERASSSKRVRYSEAQAPTASAGNNFGEPVPKNKTSIALSAEGSLEFKMEGRRDRFRHS